MNNNYTIAQRNALVEKYLWCIDTVIRKNRPLMRAARLEYDDVYQQLALRLIRPWPVLIPRRAHFSSISSHSSNMNCSTASRLTACVA